jgi:hypothetical protein
MRRKEEKGDRSVDWTITTDVHFVDAFIHEHQHQYMGKKGGREQKRERERRSVH